MNRDASCPCSVKVTFPRAFLCWRDGREGGTLHFGDYFVATGSDGPYNPEEDYLPSQEELREALAQETDPGKLFALGQVLGFPRC